MADEPVTGFSTLQFSWGGLFDGKPVGDIHLVRRVGNGTPGPTLCGIDRFAPDAPGWSVGGGFSGDYKPCADCADAAATTDLPIGGMHKGVFA